MRLICVFFFLLLVLTTSAQCQQTAEDWYNKSNASFMQAKYDEAIQYLDTAIKLDPNNVLAWGNKGYALFSQQKL
jgi:tetratricopeptide (TPR) repeat protein